MITYANGMKMQMKQNEMFSLFPPPSLTLCLPAFVFSDTSVFCVLLLLLSDFMALNKKNFTKSNNKTFNQIELLLWHIELSAFCVHVYERIHHKLWMEYFWSVNWLKIYKCWCFLYVFFCYSNVLVYLTVWTFLFMVSYL